jgi:hypothetical protein
MSGKAPDSDSYRKCKADTNIILTFIADGARACGYAPKLTLIGEPLKEAQTATTAQFDPSLLNSTATRRLKGKARKEAKQAAEEAKKKPRTTTSPSKPTVKYKVTTAEILRQVDVIVGAKRKILVPVSVQRAALRSIGLRGRFAKYFQDGGEDVSNKGHKYFIGVLKRACRSLEDAGLFERIPTVQSFVDRKPTITMIFEQLHMEMPEEDNDEALSSVRKAPTPEPVQLEPEIDEDEDVIFKFFCFLEDLHTVQDSIRDLAVGRRDEQVDDLTFLVVVNAAMIRGKQREIELLDGVPEAWRSDLVSPGMMLTLLKSRKIDVGIDKAREGDVYQRTRNLLYRESCATLVCYAVLAREKQAEYFVPVLQLHEKIGSDLGLPLNESWKEKHAFLVQFMNELGLDHVSSPTNEELAQKLIL